LSFWSTGMQGWGQRGSIGLPEPNWLPNSLITAI
jgi:hypothetical protein